jgi:hypothetical protein
VNSYLLVAYVGAMGKQLYAVQQHLRRCNHSIMNCILCAFVERKIRQEFGL